MGKQAILISTLCITAIILIVIFGFAAILSVVDLTNGCLYRYNDDGGSLSSSEKFMKTVHLNANGNYSIYGENDTPLDADYGQWVNTDIQVTGNQKVTFEIQGKVSLCKAYLPKNNLQNDSGKNEDNELIPIPRTEDALTNPVTIYLDAKTDKWRNLTQMFKDDHVVVSLLPDQTSASATTMYNSIKNSTITADCTEGARSYSPICGRYSIWNSSTNYVSSCEYKAECEECNCSRRGACKKHDWKDGNYVCVKRKMKCDWCACYEDVLGTAPEPYKKDGTYSSAWHDDLADLVTNFDRDCSTEQSYIDGNYQNQKYFWFSADNAAGLLYRIDNKEDPTSASNRGSDYNFAKIEDDQSFYENQPYKIIMNTTYDKDDAGYLQYRLHDNDGSFSDNTGGYVLNIKHTKCNRSNGHAMDDVFDGRGTVQYVIPDYGVDPNSTTISEIQNMVVDTNGAGGFTAPEDTNGYLWVKILNKAEDYKDSEGQYSLEFFTYATHDDFFTTVLDPLFTDLKDKVKAASITIFKNMTCYKDDDRADNCTSFFQYTKFMLIVYVILFGMMFLIGTVKISQADLVIRVIKVGIVGGLMNDSTFEFFNDYVFDLVTGFSDDIMANMSGYSIFSGSGSGTEKISNPFMFFNEVMTKIFLSSTFYAQVLALFAMGLNGLLYFILIFVCIGIIIVVAFRAISIYIMAFMAISVLISLAPLFLTFILFEQTRYLFDNWVKFMVRYMIEPVIMLSGIVILTQLFTIYLDYVIGYSVCWKCAIPFKIPFPQVTGVTPAFLDVPLFCFNWFAPWGFDHRSSVMGLNIQNMVILLILAQCMWGYLDFSSSMVGKLVGAGGPSATNMGNNMSDAMGEYAASSVGLDKAKRASMNRKGTELAKRAATGAAKGAYKAVSTSEGRGKIVSGIKQGAALPGQAFNMVSTAEGNEKIATGAKKAASLGMQATKKGLSVGAEVAKNIGSGIKEDIISRVKNIRNKNK